MLEHVSLWAGNLGWIKVRPEDVLAHGFSCPVSPTQRLLRCEICKNYVQLTDVSFGRIVDPFFKHLGGTFPYGGERRTSDGWEPCPDNVGGPPGGGGESPPNPEEQEIPVYLSVSGGLFNWEVKLPQLSENNATWTVNSLFEITFGEPISERYRFRFSRSGGVRFAVGANPPEACNYMIRKQNATGWTDAFLAPKSWRIVGGRGRVHLFRKGGWAAFSDDTGKLLPVGADIGVGKWVRIATKMRLAYGTGVESIRLAQKGSWMVYRVRANNCTRNAADWFLNYGLNLTAAPTQFLPVWPPSVSTRTLRIHKNPRMFFFLRGVQSAVRLWPGVGWFSPPEQGSLKGKETETIVSVPTDKTFCTLVADRWGTLLQSEYLWKRNPLSFQLQEDNVVVEDATTRDKISDGAQLPPKKYSFRLVDPMFDGCVVIRTEEDRSETIAFKAGESIPFSVNPGDIANVCLARDIVWSVSVDKPKPVPQRTPPVSGTTSRVRVPYSHAMAGVLRQLPDAGVWRPLIRSAVHRGWMDGVEYGRLMSELNHMRGEPK